MDREEMRKAFEEWAAASHLPDTYDLSHNGITYNQSLVAMAFAGWQAAMAHSCAQDAEVRKLLADAADWVDSVHDGEWPYHPFTRDDLVDRLRATLSRHGG